MVKKVKTVLALIFIILIMLNSVCYAEEKHLTVEPEDAPGEPASEEVTPKTLISPNEYLDDTPEENPAESKDLAIQKIGIIGNGFAKILNTIAILALILFSLLLISKGSLKAVGLKFEAKKVLPFFIIAALLFLSANGVYQAIIDFGKEIL